MENQWSKELIEYTRNHFGDLGTTRLKNLKPGYYAAGYDTNLYIPDEVEERIPEEIKGKQYILFIKSPVYPLHQKPYRLPFRVIQFHR